MSIAEPSDLGNTLADLLHRLGDIPPARILLRPTPGTATEQDVLAAEEAEDKRICELIDGVLVEKGMGFIESYLATFLAGKVNDWVIRHNLGIVGGESAFIRLRIGLVRVPDIAFISWDRLPGRRLPTTPIVGIAPDLAVEVLSRSNTRQEMLKKREDFFAAGTRLIWQVDPRKREVQVYASVADVATLVSGDTLAGGEVLPGFTLPLADVFDQLDRHG